MPLGDRQIKLSIIYNRKQAGKPRHDWSYKKSPVTEVTGAGSSKVNISQTTVAGVKPGIFLRFYANTASLDKLSNLVYTKCIYKVGRWAAMLTAKVFQSGNSQAIRIPKEMQTTEKEFIIRKSGNCFFLLPVNDPWALLRQSIGQAGEDVFFERDQPMLSDLQEREAL